MNSYSLKISCWNVQGFRSSIFGVKSQHSDFKKEILNSDIIIVTVYGVPGTRIQGTS